MQADIHYYEQHAVIVRIRELAEDPEAHKKLLKYMHPYFVGRHMYSCLIKQIEEYCPGLWGEATNEVFSSNNSGLTMVTNVFWELISQQRVSLKREIFELKNEVRELYEKNDQLKRNKI